MKKSKGIFSKEAIKFFDENKSEFAQEFCDDWNKREKKKLLSKPPRQGNINKIAHKK